MPLSGSSTRKSQCHSKVSVFFSPTFVFCVPSFITQCRDLLCNPKALFRLDKHVYAAGNTAKLNLEFQTAGAFTLKVKSLVIKVIFILLFPFKF